MPVLDRFRALGVLGFWGFGGLVAACGPAPARTPAPPGGALEPPGRAAEPAGQASTAPVPAQGSEPGEPAPSDQDALRVAAIEHAVNDTRDTRHACWALGAADNFHLEGTVVLRLSFSGAPQARVAVLADEPGDARLTTCLVQLYEAYRWPPVFDPGTAIELPFSFQAPRWQYTVQAAHVEPVLHDGGKLGARVVLDEQNTGNGAAAMTLLTLREGAALPLSRHTSAEILYVLKGQGMVLGADGPARGVAVRAGHAVYVPAGTVRGLAQRGKEPLELVQLFAPSGPEKHLEGGPRVGTAPVSADEARALGRAAPRPLVKAKPDVYQLGGQSAQSSVAIYFDQAATGDTAAYLGILTAQPGMKIPAHRHDRETELVLVLAGTGIMRVAGDPYPIEPMTAVQIPPGVEHAVEVTSSEPMMVVQFYTPSGPEQRFKAPRAGAPR